MIQMIKMQNTEFFLTPAHLRSHLTALVLGADEGFEMERQLAENLTRVQFYGTNFNDAEEGVRFETSLNGTQIHRELIMSSDTKGNQLEQFVLCVMLAYSVVMF